MFLNQTAFGDTASGVSEVTAPKPRTGGLFSANSSRRHPRWGPKFPRVFKGAAACGWWDNPEGASHQTRSSEAPVSAGRERTRPSRDVAGGPRPHTLLPLGSGVLLLHPDTGWARCAARHSHRSRHRGRF